MRKKLIIAGLIVMVLALILTACGSESSKPTGSNEGQNVDPSTPVQTEPPAEPAEIDPVWKGTKKDVMYEYYLMFTSKTDVYVLEAVDGEVKCIEKGTYAFNEGDLTLKGITLIKKIDYNASTNSMGATMSLASLLYYFRPSDMAIFSQAKLDALMETCSTDIIYGNKDPKRNEDGTYSYYIGRTELRASINVWDYVDGDGFDLYRMLTDHGYEYNLHQYTHFVDGVETDYFCKYIVKAKCNGKEILFQPQSPLLKDRVVNEKGLFVFESYAASPDSFVFYLSPEDIQESVYRVNDTDIGVSVDQMIFIACMIDFNARGGLGDATFKNILNNNNRLVP